MFKNKILLPISVRSSRISKGRSKRHKRRKIENPLASNESTMARAEAQTNHFGNRGRHQIQTRQPTQTELQAWAR